MMSRDAKFATIFLIKKLLLFEGSESKKLIQQKCYCSCVFSKNFIVIVYLAKMLL